MKPAFNAVWLMYDSRHPRTLDGILGRARKETSMKIQAYAALGPGLPLQPFEYEPPTSHLVTFT